MDNLYYIQDKNGNKIKFVRNESQLKFWDDMWFINIILKDRQRGFSTLIAMFILDSCLFNKNISAGIIDLTLPDAKLKLKKVSFAYRNLPDFIKETIPTTRDSAEAMEWANDSSVYVGTSHRGGTLQILHKSEMGKVSVRFPERAREIRTGALNTVAPGNFIFDESTAEGSAGEFFEDCKAAQELQDKGTELTKLDTKFHFFGWWMGTENEIDPRGVEISKELLKYFAEIEPKIGVKLSDRKKAWYSKKERQQKDDMKREFPSTAEEAFEAAIEGVYLAKIITKMEKKGQFTLIPADPGIPVNTGWDFGLHDTMTIWMHQRVGFQERIIGYMQGTDEDVFYYWKELQNMGHIWGYHFLPHDGDNRRIGTAKSAEDKPRTLAVLMAEAGMKNIKTIPRISDKYISIQETKRFLPTAVFDAHECEEGIKCLKNFRREWDDTNGCWKNRPKHDWAMHGYDGFETLARGLNAHGVITDVQQRQRRRGISYSNQYAM